MPIYFTEDCAFCCLSIDSHTFWDQFGVWVILQRVTGARNFILAHPALRLAPVGFSAARSRDDSFMQDASPALVLPGTRLEAPKSRCA